MIFSGVSEKGAEPQNPYQLRTVGLSPTSHRAAKPLRRLTIYHSCARQRALLRKQIKKNSCDFRPVWMGTIIAKNPTYTIVCSVGSMDRLHRAILREAHAQTLRKKLLI
jgi:hypothetical protein